MKPGHGKDDAAATPEDNQSSGDSADGSAPARTRTYQWLVPGSETFRELEDEIEKAPLSESTADPS